MDPVRHVGLEGGEVALLQAGPIRVVVDEQDPARGGDFAVLDQSGLQDEATALGAKIITLKKLHEGVVNKIDADSSSFWKAGQAEPGGLGLMDRQRLKMWLRDAYREIESVEI